MKTRCSKRLLAFLFLILIVPPVVADGPPKDGPHVEYYDNGQKEAEGHFKNGKYEGLNTEWHENGQKELEIQYKDGKLISQKVFWSPMLPRRRRR